MGISFELLTLGKVYIISLILSKNAGGRGDKGKEDMDFVIFMLLVVSDYA